MSVLYRSTRGDSSGIVAAEAILKGIAPDGGLYIPAAIPPIERSFDKLAELGYRDLSFYIINKFFDHLGEDTLRDCVYNAYDDKYDDSKIVPVVSKLSVFRQLQRFV